MENRHLNGFEIQNTHVSWNNVNEIGGLKEFYCKIYWEELGMMIEQLKMGV